MNEPSSLAVAEPWEQGAPPRRIEALDGPGMRQTLRDLPLSIAGSTLGYMIGHHIAKKLLDQHDVPGAPAWIKQVPRAIGILNAVGAPLAQAKINDILRRRRAERRAVEAKK